MNPCCAPKSSYHHSLYTQNRQVWKVALCAVPLLLFACLAGTARADDADTIRALQAENNLLRKQVDTLKGELAGLRALAGAMAAPTPASSPAVAASLPSPGMTITFKNLTPARASARVGDVFYGECKIVAITPDAARRGVYQMSLVALTSPAGDTYVVNTVGRVRVQCLVPLTEKEALQYKADDQFPLVGTVTRCQRKEGLDLWAGGPTGKDCLVTLELTDVKMP